jgi:hypothetical protein
MAAIVTIDRNNVRGNEIADAIDGIRNGFAVLKKFDGMRAEAIGVSAVNFGAVFGITAEPQAMSDRWAKISAGTCTYAELAEFINATVAD